MARIYKVDFEYLRTHSHEFLRETENDRGCSACNKSIKISLILTQWFLNTRRKNSEQSLKQLKGLCHDKEHDGGLDWQPRHFQPIEICTRLPRDEIYLGNKMAKHKQRFRSPLREKRKGTGQNYYTRTGPTFGVGGFSKTPPIFKLITWTLPTKFYWLLNLSWHRNIQLTRVGITRQTRKVRFESHCNFLLLDRGVAMQYRNHLLTLSKGVQADTTIYFVVWWVLFECSSFDHFPKENRWNCFGQKCESFVKFPGLFSMESFTSL